jgi:hypothetical protein
LCSSLPVCASPGDTPESRIETGSVVPGKSSAEYLRQWASSTDEEKSAWPAHTISWASMSVVGNRAALTGIFKLIAERTGPGPRSSADHHPRVYGHAGGPVRRQSAARMGMLLQPPCRRPCHRPCRRASGRIQGTLASRDARLVHQRGVSPVAAFEASSSPARQPHTRHGSRAYGTRSRVHVRSANSFTRS